MESPSEKHAKTDYGPAVISGFFFVIIVLFILETRNFSGIASTLPLVFGVPALLLAVTQFGFEIRSIWAYRNRKTGIDKSVQAVSASARGESVEQDDDASVYHSFAWFFALLFLFVSFGFIVSTPIFAAAFAHYYGGRTWLSSVTFGVLLAAAMHFFFVIMLDIRLFEGFFPTPLPF